jgi:hypothetical protein
MSHLRPSLADTSALLLCARLLTSAPSCNCHALRRSPEFARYTRTVEFAHAWMLVLSTSKDVT